MKKKRIIIAAALLLALGWGMSACGGGSAKNGEVAEADGGQTEQTAGEEQTAESAAEQTEQKAQEAKKWYEQDFQLTYKFYVVGKSMTRTYARKGNVVACHVEGSEAVNLFVFTDSTQTNYLVNPAKGRYGKVNEKSGFSTVEEGVKKYLKGQMGDDLFGKRIRKGDEGVTAKDTTIFGRPAYVLTKEATEKNVAVNIYAKTIQWVDKENDLPYYKYAFAKNGDQVITDGVAFEVTAFSASPTYEGLPMSLDGMTDVSNK